MFPESRLRSPFRCDRDPLAAFHDWTTDESHIAYERKLPSQIYRRAFAFPSGRRLAAVHSQNGEGAPDYIPWASLRQGLPGASLPRTWKGIPHPALELRPMWVLVKAEHDGPGSAAAEGVAHDVDEWQAQVSPGGQHRNRPQWSPLKSRARRPLARTQAHMVDVGPHETVGQLKQRLLRDASVPCWCFRLQRDGVRLPEHRPVALVVSEGELLELVLVATPSKPGPDARLSRKEAAARQQSRGDATRPSTTRS